ncbi:MAG: hypothetical protein JOZ24_11890, partial [Candidatus Eremiobacteraeota bacterium]|nr:hypothetical protein [Candidatus Eremiobacteraeota bacterium]
VVPGTSIAFARAASGGRLALDANADTVASDAVLDTRSRASAEVRLTTDRTRYHVGDRLDVDAALFGAAGEAFVDLEGARTLGEQTVAADGGHASAAFRVAETLGDAAIGAAFVRDGAVAFATRRIALDAPGHARITTLAADRTSYAPGTTAHLRILDGGAQGKATLAIRLADGRPAGAASFDDAAAVLGGGGTTTQSPTTDEPAWHGSVVPTRSTALDLAATERAAPPVEPVAAAEAQPLLWRVVRTDQERFEVPLPATPGRYVVSVLKVSDDGDAGGATLALEVR